MKRGVFIFWSIFIALAVIRLWQSFGIKPPDIGKCYKQTVEGVGTITVEPERKESSQIFTLRTTSLSPEKSRELQSPSVEVVGVDGGIKSNSESSNCGNILIRLKTKLYPRFKFGDEVSFTGKLSKPFNFRSDSGRVFDFEGYLAKDDVFYEIKSAKVELGAGDTISTIAVSSSSVAASYSKPTTGNTLYLFEILNRIPEGLYYLKRGFVGNLEKVLGDPHAALAAGLVVGEKSALGADLLNDFRVVGLIHIIVLSGYNITIVADALRKLLSSLPRMWGIVIGGIGIVLFGILVGGGATVVRSCVMASVALTAEGIRRDYSVLRALIFAGLIMLIQNPLILLHDPSFQLSFLATLGLVLLASPIESKLGFIPERFGMRGIVASTLATQVFVSPYILYMMGSLSIIGIVVNILVLPFIPLTMLAVFLTGMMGFVIPLVSVVLGWVTHLLLSYELFVVERFAQIPFAAIQVSKFSGWYVVVFYILLSLLCAIFLIGPKRKRSL